MNCEKLNTKRNENYRDHPLDTMLQSSQKSKLDKMLSEFKFPHLLISFRL